MGRTPVCVVLTGVVQGERGTRNLHGPGVVLGCVPGGLLIVQPVRYQLDTGAVVAPREPGTPFVTRESMERRPSDPALDQDTATGSRGSGRPRGEPPEAHRAERRG